MNIVKSLINTALMIGVLVSGTNAIAACAKDFSLGWEEYPPYQYIVDGELSGLDIELVTAIVENMGCELSYVKVPWLNNLEKVKDGNIDLALAASKTKKREKYAYFSKPYRQEKISLFVRKDEGEKYPLHALGDIIKLKFSLGVVKGYDYGTVFSKLKDTKAFQEHLIYAKSTEQNISKLIDGKINGFLENPDVAIMTMKNNNINRDRLSQHPLTVHTGDVHVMFSKKTTTEAMVAGFNKSLEQLKANGEYQKILDKYLK